MARNYCEDECDKCENQMRLDYLKLILWVALGAGFVVALGFWGTFWWIKAVM
jgi:hypothetical protein